jgi:hypothetical protein
VIGWNSYLIAEEILEGHAEALCEYAALSRACLELFGSSCRLAIGYSDDAMLFELKAVFLKASVSVGSSRPPTRGAPHVFLFCTSLR